MFEIPDSKVRTVQVTASSIQRRQLPNLIKSETDERVDQCEQNKPDKTDEEEEQFDFISKVDELD